MPTARAAYAPFDQSEPSGAAADSAATAAGGSMTLPPTEMTVGCGEGVEVLVAVGGRGVAVAVRVGVWLGVTVDVKVGAGVSVVVGLAGLVLVWVGVPAGTSSITDRLLSALFAT